jgi:DNA-binding CsgD family transcriptional regulator
MATGYQALTEKEKQTLRLMVRGHDAKSMARHLGLSVHTVNERLRDARRKLEVSSSREAARLVLYTEGERPEKLADKEIGEAAAAAGVAASNDQARAQRVVWVIAGAVIMSIILGLFALSFVSGGNAPYAATGAQSPSEAAAPIAEADVTRSARHWLELGDQGRWKDAYLGTSTSFRTSNTLELWTETAEKARPPLGALVSRTALSKESVPAPPAGVVVVKFRTDFANKKGVIETVSLVREGFEWKVVGIYLD